MPPVSHLLAIFQEAERPVSGEGRGARPQQERGLGLGADTEEPPRLEDLALLTGTAAGCPPCWGSGASSALRGWSYTSLQVSGAVTLGSDCWRGAGRGKEARAPFVQVRARRAHLGTLQPVGTLS